MNILTLIEMKKHCLMTGCSRRPRPIAQRNCVRAFAGNMIGMTALHYTIKLLISLAVIEF